MLAVEGIYENGQIRLLQMLPLLKRAKVIVTIVETSEDSDTEQENTDPHLFDDIIGAIDVREDGSVSHDHYNWDVEKLLFESELKDFIRIQGYVSSFNLYDILES